MVEKHILIIQCGSVVAVLVVISKWIFDFLFVITYPKNSCDSRAPPDSPRHHDRATPAPRISPLSPPRKNGRRCPTRRVGGVERPPPGDRSFPPRELGGSTPTEGFTASSEALPTRGRPYTNFQATFTNLYTLNSIY